MYLLTTVKNTNGLLSFDHDRAQGYDLFYEGTDLCAVQFDLRYEVKRKAGVKQLRTFHLIQSDGPELISNHLRAVIEKFAPNDVNFFEAQIFCGGEQIEGFSAINVKSKIPCMDLEASEYRITNFDPVAPTYFFSYLKLDKNTASEAEVYRCAEHPGYIVFGETLKAACMEEGIKGLMFCRAIDMTYENRSDCAKT